MSRKAKSASSAPSSPGPDPLNSPNNSGNASEVFLAFLKLGLTSFGGPIAHLGYFRKELVERRHWVSESQFSQLLAICQFLPGPASSQLGFSLGLLRAGFTGALAAFVGFTLPSALLLLGFASALPLISGTSGVAALHGLKLVALAVVADAVVGMARKLCPDLQRVVIALSTVTALLLVDDAWLQMMVVVGSAAAGVILCRVDASSMTETISVSYGNKLGTTLLVLFVALLVGLPLIAGAGSGLAPLAEAFYRAGALVFGGGHVVLPLLEDTVVASGWITNDVFLAGYGASQAIPGPMFAFSAYLGALTPTGHHAGVGAGIALTFIFLPGFLLVAGVLPFWQSISGSKYARSAIAGVNAAVVGLLAAALYDPIFTSSVRGAVDLAIAGLGFVMLARWRLPPLAVVAFCIAASILVAIIR